MTSPVLLDVVDGVATLTLNRPEALNALSFEMMEALSEATAQLSRRDDLRVVVVTGAGNHFMAGGDLKDFAGQLHLSPESRIATFRATIEQHINRSVEAFAALRVPVIARVQGFAIGGGCVLAVACDFRFSSDKGRFGIPIAKFGFMLSPIDTVRLAKLVGLSQARRLLMSGAVIDAEEAHRIGLVDRVVPLAELDAAVSAFATLLAQNAPLSLKATKQMLAAFHIREPSIGDAAALYRELYSSADLGEGLDAFFEKRPPRFRGA